MGSTATAENCRRDTAAAMASTLDEDAAVIREDSADTAVAKETPLPWDKLLVIISVRLAEPINHSIILPFVYKMVEGFGVAKSSKDVAFYASLLFT
ncbi:hypothetical protein GGI23_004094, partial [Coemansia sp. RSA 2559]